MTEQTRKSRIIDPALRLSISDKAQAAFCWLSILSAACT
jgi:hypothetical protein